MEGTTGRATTAWGDAQGRRRDILASAERLLEQSGYAGLTMRAIAAGAGVSSGTVYQYFSGKEDVFVALTTRRLEQLQATLAGADRHAGVSGVLREIVPQVTELWRRLGRSASQWEASALAGGEDSRGVVTSAAAYQDTLRALADALREAAEASGQQLVDDPALPHWVWDSLIGLADDLLLGGARQNNISRRRLIEFASNAIERGIVAQPSR
ncbi:TetR/AcrR family transcriptional regulator [Haloechinothrix sp. LS1_15]|uniref:TetR/AcrR family transcriptional regulator n=1 Tax=Haloechinothrix sp. LS1_15 TaxID=2652248 RepID=UPI00294657C7|nr:TetR/AcrR family transcriptional regulator [Haloechinothrix sp. LS1_15]MDV6011680.1 TetR/AcrR family transcriptional regulator [Haloechinothrix sp. LS1_15]